jgi:translation initiation factor 2B subunit (eIF-2B alpha/beta/delta family)
MSRSWLVITAVVGVLGVCGEIRTARMYAADANESSVSVAKQQKALAENALQVLTNLENQGRLDVGTGQVARWSRRLVEATRKSGATKAEAAEALKQHQARMDERVLRIQKRLESAKATQLDVWNAKYEALEAKMWIQEDQEN